MSRPKKIVLLGATGSIGENTLQVVRKHPDRLHLIGISAHSNAEKLSQIASEFKVPHAYLPETAGEAKNLPSFTDLDRSQDGLLSLASLPDAELVVIAVVGAKGLSPTLAALEAGKNIVLANKESLVLGGDLVMRTARENQARVLPADSEHNAVFQCIQGESHRDIDSIILTASGGPFRELPLEGLKNVTVEQALNHPNWSMGRKISVDSATLMNKGLELIEATHLFHVPETSIDVVIHPESIVHSLVEFVDGSMLAQMGSPDMRIPIAHALGFPERLGINVERLSLTKLSKLHFEPVNHAMFPALGLARQASAEGGDRPIVLNAANEIAVDAFLKQQIGFTEITELVSDCLNQSARQPISSIDDVLAVDRMSRQTAEIWITERI